MTVGRDIGQKRMNESYYYYFCEERVEQFPIRIFVGIFTNLIIFNDFMVFQSLLFGLKGTFHVKRFKWFIFPLLQLRKTKDQGCL